MKTGDFPHFKTHFGSLDSKEHLDGNDMKRKKTKPACDIVYWM